MTSRHSHHKGEDTFNLVKYERENDIWRIKPRALGIVWGGDPRYWNLSAGEGPAELLQVSWLEVTGQINLSRFLKKGKEYMVKFRVELRPDNFGWGNCPVYFMVKVGEQTRLWKKAYLNLKSYGQVFDVPINQNLTFRVPESCSSEDKLTFGMYEIWKGRWKGGLVIHEVIIAPVLYV
ncbi:hypothetical protein M5K25_012257 [Dendrobium thyrsiflorum]|uniref:Protein PHLOEM PROTEIN 2-LIKE A9-like n=1 Tax=Dendrobium thyrsiflorum TaxID=117978 RepID=A0ABD0UWI2_DENTH